MAARFGFRARALAVLVSLAAFALPVHAEEGATLAALRLAHQREVDSQHHYLAYAMQAHREGQPEAAALWRAIARGEAVHAANHLRELERLGVTVTPAVTSVVVRTTAENLAASIAGERAERTAIYPAFAEFALCECLYEPLASFGYARGAEATHEALFRAALTRFERTRPEWQLLASAGTVVEPALGTAASAPGVWICPGCGGAFAAPPAHSCKLCGTAGSTFEFVR